MIRFYEPIIWHQRGIRSHSVFNDRSYAMPVRRREPVYIPPRTTKYSSYHDYGIDDSINRADYLSNAVLEDTFEAASRSRGKDHALLRNVNAAIDSTERHVTPRVAAISRRVRASTLPPVPRTFPVQQQVYRQPYNQDGIYYRVPRSSNLQASRPPLPKPTDRKAIRDTDGFTRPKNLLSWQYRVESRLAPSDLIYEPSSFSRMRGQVKDVQEKMDRQRQLLDRYLDSDFKIPANNSHKGNTASSKTN
uniref:Uncharacterized protein n=1 Tax=Arion vulgaris TaxID=1028688 RepID=A0A0B7AFA0_9EUPU